MIAETVSEADLYTEADELSVSQGRLPEGSLLRLLGRRQSGYENVEVELTDRIAEGWVRRSALNLKKQEIQNEKWERREKNKRPEKDPVEKMRDRSNRRLLVPQDEIALIRRSPSFFYGLVGEVPMAYIGDSANNLYTGLNYRLGAHVGMFITPSLPFRFEVAYARMAGTADDASAVGPGTAIEIGFVDIRTQLELQLGPFMLIGFGQYSFGAGVAAAPPNITFESAGSLSSFWVGGGAGYRIGFGEPHSLLLQGTYSMSLITTPVSFQAVGIRVLWEIRG